MELKIGIDEHCKLCKEGVRYFKNLNRKHKKFYANMNMKNYKLLKGIYITPDYNCSGYLTHFHIIKATRQILKKILEGLEANRKEAILIKIAKKKQEKK